MRIIIEIAEHEEISVQGTEDKSETPMDAGPPHRELLTGMAAASEAKRDLRKPTEVGDAGTPPQWLEGVIEGGSQTS